MEERQDPKIIAPTDAVLRLPATCICGPDMRDLPGRLDLPSDDLIPSFLAASDVLGTGWFGAVAAQAGPGKPVAVVGDGAVGLLAMLAAEQLGAERNSPAASRSCSSPTCTCTAARPRSVGTYRGSST